MAGDERQLPHAKNAQAREGMTVMGVMVVAARGIEHGG